MTLQTTKPRRGRPPKNALMNRDTKAELIRSGLEQLTESGFASSGIEPILKKVGVPKGSFYHYFSNKEAFGLAVIKSYDSYFANKLDKYLLDENYAPLIRIENFVESAKSGLKRYQFKRGCLVGNLGQEVDLLPDSYRQVLIDIFYSWQQRIERCLIAAKENGDLNKTANCEQLADFFWVGWEGAVSRTRLSKSCQPIDNYIKYFMAVLPR